MPSDAIEKLRELAKEIAERFSCCPDRYCKCGADARKYGKALEALLPALEQRELISENRALKAPIVCTSCGWDCEEWERMRSHVFECKNSPLVKRIAALEQRERELREVVMSVSPTVEFYLKREISAPANHQEFAREAQQKLDKWNKLRTALGPEGEKK